MMQILMKSNSQKKKILSNLLQRQTPKKKVMEVIQARLY